LPLAVLLLRLVGVEYFFSASPRLSIIFSHHYLLLILLFFLLIPPPPRSTLFPYTTLFRSHWPHRSNLRRALRAPVRAAVPEVWVDRKSTRLNSSHGSISYAVFCLKKKTKKRQKNVMRLKDVHERITTISTASSKSAVRNVR